MEETGLAKAWTSENCFVLQPFSTVLQIWAGATASSSDWWFFQKFSVEVRWLWLLKLRWIVWSFVTLTICRYGMKRSLDVFQAEWYEMQQSGKFKARCVRKKVCYDSEVVLWRVFIITPCPCFAGLWVDGGARCLHSQPWFPTGGTLHFRKFLTHYFGGCWGFDVCSRVFLCCVDTCRSFCCVRS